MADDDEFSDNEIWFRNNSDFFPPELRKNMELVMDMAMFHNRVFKKVMEELGPKLRKLMLKQYPLFQTETRPLVVNAIDDIANSIGNTLLFSLYGLVQDQKNGVDLREKYPDFDSWLELYVRPNQPHLLEISFYDDFPQLSYEQKKELVDEINEQDIEGSRLYESQKFEFFELIQKVVLKHYLALQELEGDGWNVYSIHVGMEYRMYCDDCCHIEHFIENKLPEEDIKLTFSEYMKKLDDIREAKKDEK